MGLIKEFKEFIAKGNVMDMAVGVVVGGAFKGIIDSLVADIITPLITSLTGKVDVTELFITIGNTKFPYGNFIQQIINFLIISICMFLVIKAFNTARNLGKKKAEEEAVAAGPTTEELLTDIKILLKEQNDREKAVK